MNHLSYIRTLFDRYSLLGEIIQAMSCAGLKPILVGGSIRDYFLGISFEAILDHDIEVYGCSLDQLQTILERFGVVRIVGKSFGVLKLDGLPVDWSVPRSDSVGRKPTVSFDPCLSYQEAFARRDLTINAIGIDCITGDLVDPYHGLPDLKKRIARSPRISLFGQDPLRLFRLAQFISRFELTVDSALEDYCKNIELDIISKTRIGQEVKKLLLLSKKPSKGIRWLHSISRLSDLCPELAELAVVPQGVQWHPEGDVLEHSLQALDAMAVLARVASDDQKRLTLLLAALFHDVGKKETTLIMHDRISSHGHAQKGAQKIGPILKRFDIASSIVDGVKSLIFYHMHSGQFVRTGARIKAYKWLAHDLDSTVCLVDLADLFLADLQGRNPEKMVPLDHSMEEVEQFRAIIAKAGIARGPEKPLLCAADFIAQIQGKALGDLLSKAYALQIDESISDPLALKEMVLKTFMKN